MMWEVGDVEEIIRYNFSQQNKAVLIFQSCYKRRVWTKLRPVRQLGKSRVFWENMLAVWTEYHEDHQESRSKGRQMIAHAF